MDRMEDLLAKLAAKVGLNDNVTPESVYRRPEDYMAAIAEYLDEGAGGGSGGSGCTCEFAVHDSEGVLDKTYAEIYAMAQTKPVILIFTDEDGMLNQRSLVNIGFNNGANKYKVKFEQRLDGEYWNYEANSENDNPFKGVN